MDAKAYQVNFHYSVEFDPAFVIDPVDLCAILSNQIDNALEACQQLPEGTKRSIDVKIWSQNDQILFLQVLIIPWAAIHLMGMKVCTQQKKTLIIYMDMEFKISGIQQQSTMGN